MKIIVDPSDHIAYKSFYIYAFSKRFGKMVKYKNAPFSMLSSQARNTRGIRICIQQESYSTNLYISGNDSYEINDELYNWCDIYGSVNTNRKKTDSKYYDKLMPLCPSFGVRCWSDLYTTYRSIIDCFISKQSKPKTFFGQYKRLQEQRLPYEAYSTRSHSKDSYAFFCSTLWYSDEWNRNDERVNLTRARYIRACKKIEGLDFEGGLVSQGRNRSSEELFADCLTKRTGMEEWLAKTKASSFVFNTPAFWDCHGWKLGEYLAMGKCIISTQLSNDLPHPLVHGENIHFVENNEQAMMDAILYIMSNPDYRRKLEQGAYDYWKQYGSPDATLNILFSKINRALV